MEVLLKHLFHKQQVQSSTGGNSTQTTDEKTKAAEIIKNRGNFKIYFKVSKNITFKKDVGLYVRQYIYHMLNDKPNIFKEFIESFYSSENPQTIDTKILLEQCKKNFQDAIVYHNREVERDRLKSKSKSKIIGALNTLISDQLKPKIIGKLIIEGKAGSTSYNKEVLVNITGKASKEDGTNLYNEISNLSDRDFFIQIITEINNNKNNIYLKKEEMDKETEIKNNGSDKAMTFKEIIQKFIEEGQVKEYGEKNNDEEKNSIIDSFINKLKNPASN